MERSGCSPPPSWRSSTMHTPSGLVTARRLRKPLLMCRAAGANSHRRTWTMPKAACWRRRGPILSWTMHVPIGLARRSDPVAGSEWQHVVSEADVCLIVEGGYPYVLGGVASWMDALMRASPQLRFYVISIGISAQPRVAKYAIAENVVGITDVILDQAPIG